MVAEEWALTALRLWGVLRVQALWRQVVGPTWELVAAALAILLAPAVHAVAGSPARMPESLPIRMLLEFSLGTVIGLVASLPGHALLGSAKVGARELALHDPGSTGPSATGGAWRALTAALVVATAVGLELHHPLLVALTGVAELWPIGAPTEWGLGSGDAAFLLRDLARAAHLVTLLALSLATPVLLSVAVVDLCARTVAAGPAPAEALAEATRPWLRVALALIALGASWAAFPEDWAAALG